MPKIIHILSHNIEDFMAGNYEDFDHHSIRFMEKVRHFSQNADSNFEQELWILSKKAKKFEVSHKKGFKIRFFPISIKLPLPLEISFPLLKEIIKFQSLEKTIWHLQSYYLFMYDLVAPVLFIKKQKFIMQFHGGGPSYRLKAILYTIYHYLIGLRITLNLAKFVIILNRNEEKRVNKFLRVKQQKILYFPSTVPLSSLSKAPETFQNKTKTFKIVVAGRIEKIKKGKFIPLFTRILSKNQNTLLEIIGLKEKDKELIDLQKKFSGRVCLIPWLEREKLLEKFQQSDVYLHLFNKNEGSPITLIEALSQGLPVLAFDVEGVRDIVKNNFNGWLVKDEKQFEEKLQDIIKNPEQILSLKNNCLNSIKEGFIDGKYFPKLIKIYLSLISS